MKYSLLKLSVLAAIMNTANAAFRGSSLVTTPSGETKKIKHLDVGDHVNAYSPLTEARGRAIVLAKALSEDIHSTIDIDLGHKTVRASSHQKVFDVAGHYFIRAKDLTPYNVLLAEDGTPLNIVGVKRRKASCCSGSNSYEVTIDTKDHAFFVDGILCHNGGEMSTMAKPAVEVVVDNAIKESVKQNILGGVSPTGLAIMGKIAIKAHEGIQESNAAMARGDLIPVESNISWGEQNGLIAPPPVAEVAPAAAPKRRVNQDAVQKWRQANRNSVAKDQRATRVIGPSNNLNNNAVVQIPNMVPEGHHFPSSAGDMRTEKQMRADAKAKYKKEQEERKQWKAEKEQKKVQEINDRANEMLQAQKEAEAKKHAENPNKKHPLRTQEEAMLRRDAGLPYKHDELPPVDPLESVYSLPTDPKELQDAKMRILREMADKRASELNEKAAALSAPAPQVQAPLQMPVENPFTSMFPGINKPLPPKVMSSVNKSIERAAALQEQMIAARATADARRAAADRAAEVLALPPYVGVGVLTKAGHQAQENNRQRQMQDHLEKMRQMQEQRRAQEQQRFNQVRNAESAQKSEDSQKTQRQNDEILRQRLLGKPNK